MRKVLLDAPLSRLNAHLYNISDGHFWRAERRQETSKDIGAAEFWRDFNLAHHVYIGRSDRKRWRRRTIGHGFFWHGGVRARSVVIDCVRDVSSQSGARATCGGTSCAGSGG